MSAPWPKYIIHVDMDAFFAAIEQLLNPELRGKPVIIGAKPKKGKGRGVVSTASYEARPYGVHSAMPISRAYRLCPDGIYIPPNGKLYSEYSQKIFALLDRFTPVIQKISIDEAFLDVAGHPVFHQNDDVIPALEQLGREIKDCIFSETGLKASLGIAPSKSVAKIASDFDKPDGLTIVPPEKVQDFLDPLPVRRIWGVGKRAFESLSRLGIQTVRELRQFEEDYLEERFGKMGPHLYRMARGIDKRNVVPGEDAKSVSHERTFGVDQTDRDLLLSTILDLSEKVSSRLRKYQLKGKTIQIKLRFSDFSTFTRNKTLPDHTNLTEEIFNISKMLFNQFKDASKPVRLIGVGVSQLANEAGLQMSLWDSENERKAKLEKVMDQLQDKYGASALTHAQTLKAKRRKEPPAKGNTGSKSSSK